MDTLGAPALAFVVAAFFSLLELVTSQFPQTFSFLRRSGSFYAYGVAYGTLALLATIGINKLSAANAIKLKELGYRILGSELLLSAISLKALLHIRLFNVTAWAETFPVGVETLLQLLALRRINIQHWNATQAFIATRASQYTDLESVRKSCAVCRVTSPK